MKKHLTRKNILVAMLAISTIFLFTSPLTLQAKDYDYYVDRSVSKSGDGSEEKPFKTISEAVEKGGDIYIADGKYNEDLELGKSTRIYGENESGVVISGKIIMGNDTLLRDITARGVKTAISIKKNADAEIENCTIKDFGKIGIEAVSGGGKLKVTDSKIQNGDGKGFYIERGKEIELIGNEVADNDEEGIDIRSKVKGIVRNNLITKNGESGIELIIGTSNLQIESNTIKKNGSSGIATQFYPERDSKGQVNVISNSIGDNKKYGLDCNRPQGGVPGNSYWKDSIEMEGNNIYANKIKSINDYCNLIDAVDENEESDNAISETKNEEDITDNTEKETEPELTEEEKRQIEEEEHKERELKEQKLSEIESLLKKQETLKEEIEKNVEYLKSESKLKIFFLGVNTKKLNDLFVKIKSRRREFEQVQALMEEIDLKSEEEISLQETFDNSQNEINQQIEFVNNKKKSFSLFGWVRNLF